MAELSPNPEEQNNSFEWRTGRGGYQGDQFVPYPKTTPSFQSNTEEPQGVPPAVEISVDELKYSLATDFPKRVTGAYKGLCKGLIWSSNPHAHLSQLGVDTGLPLANNITPDQKLVLPHIASGDDLSSQTPDSAINDEVRRELAGAAVDIFLGARYPYIKQLLTPESRYDIAQLAVHGMTADQGGDQFFLRPGYAQGLPTFIKGLIKLDDLDRNHLPYELSARIRASMFYGGGQDLDEIAVQNMANLNGWLAVRSSEQKKAYGLFADLLDDQQVIYPQHILSFSRSLLPFFVKHNGALSPARIENETTLRQRGGKLVIPPHERALQLHHMVSMRPLEASEVPDQDKFFLRLPPSLLLDNSYFVPQPPFFEVDRSPLPQEGEIETDGIYRAGEVPRVLAAFAVEDMVKVKDDNMFRRAQKGDYGPFERYLEFVMRGSRVMIPGKMGFDDKTRVGYFNPDGEYSETDPYSLKKRETD